MILLYFGQFWGGRGVMINGFAWRWKQIFLKRRIYF